MSPELQKYYEDRLSMMGTKAWNDLMEDVQNMLDATDKLSSVSETYPFEFRKGEVSMMKWLLSLKEVSEKSYEQLKGENEESA